MFNPRGAHAGRLRLSVRERYDDGSESRRTVSGEGIIVRVRDDSESRRTFGRFCRANRVILKPLNSLPDHGTYNRRTGKRVLDKAETPTTFQAIADGDVLAVLKRHPAVAAWEHVVSVRVPVVAGGSGSPSAGAERRIRQGVRDGCERAADRDAARRREHEPDPVTEQLRAAGAALGIDPSDPVRMPWLGELIRLCAAGEAGSDRAVRLRAELGI